MANGTLRKIARDAPYPSFVPAPGIDPEIEVIPDWKRTRDKIATRGDFVSKPMRSLKKGGKVKKTGPVKLHKGERVLTAKTAKKLTPAKVRAAIRKPVRRR